MSQIPILVITGPTATGKTALSIRLAKALSGEIISADSMQIYEEMTIGTAKPTIEEREGIPHHLMDFLSPKECFSVAAYCELADKVAADIHSRGKLPILVGGTGMYIRSFLHHFDFHETMGDTEIRERLQQEAEEDSQKLYDRLCTIDPITAAQIHPNAKTRVVRALEIYECTGKTKTEWDKESRNRESPYRSLIFALNFDNRSTLYDRINHRVDLMMRKGLLREVEELCAAGIGRETTAMQAIGYKELYAAIEKECTVEEAVEAIKQGSRRYAKRQLTWLRKEEGVRFLTVDGKDTESLAQEILTVINHEGFLK